MADEIFSFPGANYTKDAITSGLRYAFQNVPGLPDYKYDPVEANNKIQIYKEFPRRIFRPPTIVVKAGSATMDMTYLGEVENSQEVLADPANAYQIVQGKMMIPITVKVYALTTTDREKITDLVAFFFRHLFRTKFAALNLAYTKIRQNGEDQFTWDNQIVYTNGVSVDIYQEYKSQIPIDISQMMDDFEITFTVEAPLDPGP